MDKPLPVPSPQDNFWVLNLGTRRPVACDYATWLHFQDTDQGEIAHTVLPTDLEVTTRFIGRRDADGIIFFETMVESDLGYTFRFTDTYEDAARMHTMECQRLNHVIEQNRWTKV
jgi:hypothetical protein